MAASLLGIGLFLAGANAFGQQPYRAPYGSSPFRVAPAAVAAPTDNGGLHFSKDPTVAPTPSGGDVLHFTKQPATTALPAAPAPAPAAAWKPVPAPAPFGILPAVMQVRDPVPPAGNVPGVDNQEEYYIQLDPPGPQRLFRLEGEMGLQERMRQEALQRPSPDRIEFPTYRALATGPFTGRHWPCQQMVVEPCYLCYGRLLFEQINFDRYGWDLGFIAPVVSAALFYKDVALLPYHMAENPCCCCECDPGYCLPGDPVPLMLYPPHLSLTGAAGEAAAILLLAAMFP